MKRKSLLLTFALLAFASLTSCGSSGSTGAFMEPVEKDGYFRPHRSEWSSTYVDLRLQGGMGYSNENFTEIVDMEFDGVYKAVTDVKALVVPVDFVGYEADSLPKGAEGTLDDLNKAVFGKAEDTNWQSLKSYYDAVSFGQCQVSGVVTDWFHTNVTPKQFANGEKFGPNHEYTGAKSQSAVRALIRAIQEHYFGPDGQYDVDDFDGNGDGVVDSLLLIYSAPPHVGNIDNELFWAFCGDSDQGNVNRYFWASYETFWEYNYNPETKEYKTWTREEIANGIAKIDPHTLIHEFGHVISAPDYYDYDYGSYNPYGSIDMMDHNIGDHNSLTKGWYGWVAPYIVEEDCSITINSTTDSGEFIIVPLPGKWYARDDKDNRWDGTLLDQFLMIEFLTPTGVVTQEADHSYNPNYPVYYSDAAIRISHVDARIGMFDFDSNFKGYTIQTRPGVQGVYHRTAATNTGGLAADTRNTSRATAYPDDRLLTLVSSEPNRRNWKQRGGDSGNNADLWVEGDVLENYKFFGRSGVADTEFPFKITIGKISGMDKATIKFERTDLAQ